MYDTFLNNLYGDLNNNNQIKNYKMKQIQITQNEKSFILKTLEQIYDTRETLLRFFHRYDLMIPLEALDMHGNICAVLYYLKLVGDKSNQIKNSDDLLEQLGFERSINGIKDTEFDYWYADFNARKKAIKKAISKLDKQEVIFNKISEEISDEHLMPENRKLKAKVGDMVIFEKDNLDRVCNGKYLGMHEDKFIIDHFGELLYATMIFPIEVYTPDTAIILTPDEADILNDIHVDRIMKKIDY